MKIYLIKGFLVVALFFLIFNLTQAILAQHLDWKNLIQIGFMILFLDLLLTRNLLLSKEKIIFLNPNKNYLFSILGLLTVGCGFIVETFLLTF